MTLGPTYLYKDMVTGELYEVRQRITEPAFKTLGDLWERTGSEWKIPTEWINHPVERQINCEGGASISGPGVFKPGPIAPPANKKKRQKLHVHTYTLDDIMREEDEDE